MRKIKFRGKRLDNGEWVYGDLTHGVAYTSEDTQQDYRIGTSLDCCSVAPDTIGQFTDVYDRNTNKVYENDIVRICGELHVVRWGCGAFWVGGHKGSIPLGDIYHKNVSVVGNVFDNTELLVQSSDLPTSSHD